LPSQEGRLAILRVHTRSVKLSTEVDLEQVAAASHGFSGAELANVVNEVGVDLLFKNSPSFLSFVVGRPRYSQ
jgi:cell division protease FtsH